MPPLNIGVSMGRTTVPDSHRVAGSPASTDQRHGICPRVVTNGARFEAAGRPFPVRGVTYGTFVARADGALFPEAARIALDFETMAQLGINVVRTYTLPPTDLVESAADHGLRLMVGLHHHDWRTEHGVGRGASRRIRDAADAEVDVALARLAGNPAVFAVSVGNEIPVDLVRLHGAHRIEAVLARMIERFHLGDPELLTTYVNFPTTEFLSAPGQDFVSFNVFLDDPTALRAYLGRLQVMNEGVPVLVSEIGVPGARRAEVAQAAALDRQLRSVDESGCAGAIVFSWTDDWAVGDEPVTGWGFGLTTADRTLKPTAGVVRSWTERRAPGGLRDDWPPMSVVVCAYNEEKVIDACIRSLLASSYPELEIIVCDDGSTDATAQIVSSHPVTLLSLERGGLSRARNVGFEHASGEIVAYLDADAECDRDWPYYLAMSLESGAAATGGPNLPFDDAGFVERAVAASPGNARQVLLSHDRAEHVPGCNMAFRRDVLHELGGFNPRFTTAGDDVDLCWRLTDAGHCIAYAPAAQIHHHRREGVRRYARQQRGYGRAERLLADVHPDRFNRLGQPRWSGTVYGMTPLLPRLVRPVVYTGWQGLAPYQTVERRRAEAAAATATAVVPLAVAAFVLGAVLVPLSTWWSLLAAGAMAAIGGFFAAIATGVRPPWRETQPRRYRLTVAALHIVQPVARTWGRLRTRSERLGSSDLSWSGERRRWLVSLSKAMAERGVRTVAGPDGRAWDIRCRWGPLAVAVVNVAVVWNHDARARVRVRPTWAAVIGVVAVGALTWTVGVVVCLFTTVVVLVAVVTSMAILRSRARAAIRATAPHCSIFDTGGA